MRVILVSLVLLSGTAACRAAPWQRHTIDDSSRGADGVRVADVNGDGLMDITTGWEQGGVIRVYLNPGAESVRSPWPAVTVGEVGSPEDAVFADLDGDGAMDVVSCCEGSTQTVYIHWAPKQQERYLDAAAWTTSAVPCTENRTRWMFALPMQVDGEGGVDLVVGSKSPSATVGWLRSPNDPRDLAAWTFYPLYEAGWIMSLQARDMDGDGDKDVLVSDRKGARRGIVWLQNPGPKAVAAGAEWKQHRLGDDDREVMFLTMADMDRDGRRDVVCAVRGRGVSFLRATGEAEQPWRHHEIPMPEGCGTGKGVAVCDVDGDGRNDVIFTCENSGGKSGVRWLSYRESPTEPEWADHEISGPVGTKYDRIELLDLDRDGDLDVVTCEESENLGVIWYENPSR
ncbi:MAG: FG-GAP repeat domain-containing protein [Armatimonadota bacterium]